MSVLCDKKTQQLLSMRVGLSLLGLFLVACTQTNPAQVRDITDSAVVARSQPIIIDRKVSKRHSPKPQTIMINRPVIQYNGEKLKRVANVSSSKPVVTGSVVRMNYSRNYDRILKGEYKDDFYRVKHGDTLFYIAWITGKDYRRLAAQNNIQEPNGLRVGQILNVKGNRSVFMANKETKTVTSPSSRNTALLPQPPAKRKNTVAPVLYNGLIKWQWPAQGKIIEWYSMKSKGIDIGGKLGDKVMAAAAGQVVYAGSALPGYGNLIIVKHSNDYLTAYAHNQAILVKEQQNVNAGDQIATMGNTGTSSARLHFEIRYKAKSIDPVKYLPKQ